jgi:hypothetical protein
MKKRRGAYLRRNTTKRHVKVMAPEYRAWIAMRQRCAHEHGWLHTAYAGRGIYVCERWATSFANFYADMGPRPEGTSLDRIDNDGPYTPENCRWATRVQQARNKRNTIWLYIDGNKMAACDVAEQHGISTAEMNTRRLKGWTLEQAVGLEVRNGGKVSTHA